MGQLALRQQLNPKEDDLAELTVCVCTNRIQHAMAQLELIAESFRAVRNVLIVIDGPHDCADLADNLRELGIRGQIQQLWQAPGLSECRNHAMRRSRTRFLLFIDDDALPEVDALREAASELARGAAVVGARLVPSVGVRFPWYVTHGQYHLLGVHSPHSDQTPIWGAFMGIDTLFVAEHALRFSRELGRSRGGLQSGDDSSFIQHVRASGGLSLVLKRIAVVHNFCASRLSMRYLVRRSWWQGRSEVRRQSVTAGLLKEVRRNLAAPRSPRGLLTGAICIGEVFAGALFEGTIRRVHAPHYRS